MRQLSTIHPHPDNPRLIRDQEFKDLKRSLEAAPWMMAERPIIVDETGAILAGNKRFHALQDLGHIEVPDDWIRDSRNLTDAQKRELMVKDNTHYGEWDFTVAPDTWQALDMDGWGVTPDWGGDDPKPKLSRKRHNAEGLEALEIMLPPDDRKRARALMARVKKAQGLDTLAQAFMHIISRYPKK